MNRISVESAYSAICYAKEVYYVAAKSQYPIGEPVTWLRGEHLQEGRVSEHLYRDAFKVVNASTGKTVKLFATDFFQR